MEIKIKISNKKAKEWEWILQHRYGKKKLERCCIFAIMEIIRTEAQNIGEESQTGN